MKLTLSAAILILTASPFLYASSFAGIPETGATLLIGAGLIAGACISRRARR